MAHRTFLMPAVTCLWIGLALCAGCRKDLIDQTPVDGSEGLALEVAPPEPGMAVEDQPGEAHVAGAEGSERPAGGASSAGGGTPTTPHGSTGATARPRSGEAATGRASAGGAGGGERRGPEGTGGGSGERLRGGPGGGDGERQGPIQRWDENGDGLLQRAEAPEHMREQFMRADTNKDGAVSREEMQAAMPPPGDRPQLSPEERRKRMMERMDANGDGKITIAELPERMRERMKQADTNSDGVLSPQELEAVGEAMRRMRPGGGGPRGGGGGQRGGD